MKKIFIFVLITLLSLSGLSQSITKLNNGIENNYSDFSNYLSNKNNPSIIENSFWKNGGWDLDSRDKYKYSNDKFIEKLTFLSPFTDTASRITYQYDSLNRVTLIITEYNDNSSSLLRFVNRNSYSYLSSNSIKQTVLLTEVYNNLTNNWENYKRQTLTYNSFDHLLENLQESFVGGKWELDIGSYKFYYEYLNPSSNKITVKIDSFNYNGYFEPNNKNVKVYNDNDIEFKRISFEYNNGWDTTQMEIVEFDNTGIPSYVKVYTKDNTLGYLTERIRYDSLVWDNYDISKSFYEQIPISHCSAQKNNSDYEYVFKFTIQKLDTNGSEIKIRYNYINQKWVPGVKDIYLYDSELKLLHNERSDFINNNWIIQFGNKYEYTYENENLIKVIKTNYSQPDDAYINSHKIEYIDYVNTGLFDKIQTLEVKLFPNPSVDGKVYVNVRMENKSELNIKVIDLNGKIISSQTYNLEKGLNTLELTGLNQGLYFIVLTSDDGVSKTKLIVK